MSISHKKTPFGQLAILLTTGLVLGLLVMTQARYYTSYVSSDGRDSSENVFRKIQILKTSNDELEDEIIDLEAQLEDLSNQALALESIDKDIKKNEIIAGEVSIHGPGIKLEFGTEISDIWLTDLTNELLASGAEAISVNNIRLTDSTVGFDTLPNGQIMLNSVILTPPYTFSAIGDKATLKQAIEAPRGILDRITGAFNEFEYTLEEKDRIEMEQI
ncbi:DUF881 domain-containing protein [Patescibacteria group bacterium]